jgi:hypothetical protein
MTNVSECITVPLLIVYPHWQDASGAREASRLARIRRTWRLRSMKASAAAVAGGAASGM